MNTNHTQQSILNQQQDESHTPTMKETKENPYMLATWHGYVRFLIRISSMASVVYWQWIVIADRLSSVPEHLRRECSTWIASSFGVEGMIFLFSLERIAETPNHDPLRHHSYHVWGQIDHFFNFLERKLFFLSLSLLSLLLLLLLLLLLKEIHK